MNLSAVNICLGPGQYLVNFILICMILFVFIAITLFILSFGVKDNVENNWLEYRNNPLFLPFAGLIDTGMENGLMTNFNMSIFQKIQSLGNDMLQPLGQMTDIISSILKSFTDQIQKIREFFFTFKNLFLNFIQQIMQRISDGASTIQYLISKIKAIFERLWGIMVTLIYTTFTAMQTVSSTWNGPIGGFARFFCFDGNTKIKLINKTKSMKFIKIGDQLEKGGKVLGFMKFLVDDAIMCDYNGVIVSGTHLVYENGKWKRIFDTQKHKIISYKKKFIYCLVTENNVIQANNCLFRDYIETSDPTVNHEIKRYMLNYLNNNQAKMKINKNDKNYYVSGFHKNTLIKMKNGNKRIKDIILGEYTFNNKKIIGKIILKANKDNIYKYKNIKAHGDNIIYLNGQWIKLKNHKLSRKIKYNHKYLYHICTEDNIIIIKDQIFRDYEEVSDLKTNKKCDKLVIDFLNCNNKKKK